MSRGGGELLFDGEVGAEFLSAGIFVRGASTRAWSGRIGRERARGSERGGYCCSSGDDAACSRGVTNLPPRLCCTLRRDASHYHANARPQGLYRPHEGGTEGDGDTAGAQAVRGRFSAPLQADYYCRGRLRKEAYSPWSLRLAEALRDDGSTRGAARFGQRQHDHSGEGGREFQSIRHLDRFTIAG